MVDQLGEQADHYFSHARRAHVQKIDKEASEGVLAVVSELQ